MWAAIHTLDVRRHKKNQYNSYSTEILPVGYDRYAMEFGDSATSCACNVKQTVILNDVNIGNKI